MKECFGGKVYKLALDGGFGCPHRSGGGRGPGGCTFCAEGSGHFAEGEKPSLSLQLSRAKARVASKMGQNKPRYMAYFQAYTNTYTTPEKLRGLLLPLCREEEIVGISLGTRPDCLPDEMVALLAEISRIKPLWIELGLQTAHDETARRINRGYDYACFLEAVRKLHEAGIETAVHLIYWLPGESREMMLETVRQVSKLPLQGVKLQLLHVLKGTPLAEQYAKKPFALPEPEEWYEILARSLELLPEHFVIHRLSGDGPKESLIAPLWTGDKRRVLNGMQKYFREHDVRQGLCFGKM